MDLVENLTKGLYGTGSISTSLIPNWTSGQLVLKGGYRQYTDGFIYQAQVKITAGSSNSTIAPPLNLEAWRLIRSVYTTWDTNAPLSFYATWADSTAYTAGDSVYDDFDLNDYVCLNNHTSGGTDANTRPSQHLRTEAGITAPNWVLKGRANAFRMFDGETLTRTKHTATLTCTFVTSAACNTFMLYGLRGVSTISIQAKDGAGNNLGSAQTKSTEYAAPDTGKYAGNLRITLTTTGATRYALTLTKASGASLVECGLAVAGVADALGDTEVQAALGALSYSRTAADDFGQRQLVKRGYSRDLSAHIYVDQARLDYASQRLLRLMGEVLAVDLNNSGTDFEQLRVWGLLKDVKSTYYGWPRAPSSIDIQIESMVED